MSQIIVKGQDSVKHVLSLKYIFKSVDFMELRYLLKDMLQSMHGFPLESLVFLLQYQWCLLGRVPISSILNPLKSRRTLFTDFTMCRMRPCAGKHSSLIVFSTVQHALCFLLLFFSNVIRDDNLQRGVYFFSFFPYTFTRSECHSVSDSWGFIRIILCCTWISLLLQLTQPKRFVGVFFSFKCMLYILIQSTF